MPAFVFRLESLLSVRAAARDAARAALEQVLAIQEDLIRQRAELDVRMAEQAEALRAAAAPGSLDVDRLRAANRYQHELAREQAVLAAREQACDRDVEAAREAVMAADGELRALEKLRERQLLEFRRQQARAEAKLLDEVAQRPTASARRGAIS